MQIPAAMAIALALLWTTGPTLADSRSGGDLNLLLAGASSTGHPPYRALRRLEAGNPDSGKQGWLEVWTELTPGQGLTYEVVSEGGTDYIRNKVLRAVLNGEQRLVARREPLRAPLVASNYAFNEGGATEAGLLRILIEPLRKGAGLVTGSVLFDPADGRLVRIEGRLVKNPSFWVRNVDMVWTFEKIGDHVVPVEVSSTARVRMFGMSSFRMKYDYVSVAGRAVTDGPPRHKEPEKPPF